MLSDLDILIKKTLTSVEEFIVVTDDVVSINKVPKRRM